MKTKIYIYVGLGRGMKTYIYSSSMFLDHPGPSRLVLRVCTSLKVCYPEQASVLKVFFYNWLPLNFICILTGRQRHLVFSFLTTMRWHHMFSAKVCFQLLILWTIRCWHYMSSTEVVVQLAPTPQFVGIFYSI